MSHFTFPIAVTVSALCFNTSQFRDLLKTSSILQLFKEQERNQVFEKFFYLDADAGRFQHRDNLAGLDNDRSVTSSVFSAPEFSYYGAVFWYFGFVYKANLQETRPTWKEVNTGSRLQCYGETKPSHKRPPDKRPTSPVMSLENRLRGHVGESALCFIPKLSWRINCGVSLCRVDLRLKHNMKLCLLEKWWLQAFCGSYLVNLSLVYILRKDTKGIFYSHAFFITYKGRWIFIDNTSPLYAL